MKIFNNIGFEKLKAGLSKTRYNIITKITETITGKVELYESTLADLEEALITSDIGFYTTEKIIDKARSILLKESGRSTEKLKEIIKEELLAIFKESISPEKIFEKNKYHPYVILVVGVNGSGKTTSIGKIAHNYKSQGLNVIIGSADTFRAAANDQLNIWAKRAGVQIISPNSTDPSAVAFDTITTAINNKLDIAIIDTAGRLHTQKNLMEELSKIKKVINSLLSFAPNEVLLVLDGTAGQNALYQANEFEKFTNITGLIVTKLDGTAKGGVIFQICAEKIIPVRYIGIGEGIDDLQLFDPETFVEALFN